MEQYLKWNCSSLFLIKPITGLKLLELKNAGFISSYIYFKEEEGLFLLFEKEKEEYDILLYSQKENPSFINEEIYENKIVWRYKIPLELKNDFEKFKKGEYSTMSNFYKKHFDKIIKNSLGFEIKSLQWKVFEKDPKLKKDIEEYIGSPIDESKDYYQLPSTQRETLIL